MDLLLFTGSEGVGGLSNQCRLFSQDRGHCYTNHTGYSLVSQLADYFTFGKGT